MYEKIAPEDLLGPLNSVERRNAPKELFLGGDRALLTHGRRVSVVGSRKATSAALQDADVVVKFLVRNGVVVVSGLAEGIDTKAHATAIVAKGKTVAVLATPLDECYPRKNLGLQKKIMSEHLAVTQFSSGMSVRRENFPMRNRTMALLSDATVIIEAGEKSGSLHQGWEALRLGRPLFIAERLFTDRELAWVGEMQKYGARRLSLDGLDLLLESLPEGARGEALQLAI
jgi:DNA processing protein